MTTEQAGTTAAVTGASGFIGGRLVERLVERGVDVTCLLRRDPGPRLQRTGAKFRKIHIADQEAVREALREIDWIFHCAYDWNDTAWNFRALDALIAACRDNKRRRLVHVGSFVAYDIPPMGELTEETIGTTSRSGYGHIKRELDNTLLKAAREDAVRAVIVQPTIVYGPYCKPWTIDPADMLRNGTVILPDQGRGICNAVYVDDVVDAMILAAQAPAAVGQRFLVSGEPVTWAQFYEAMAKAAGAKGPRYMPAEAIVRENTRLRKLLRLFKTPGLMVRRLAGRRSIRKLLRAGLKVLPETVRADTDEQLYGPPSRQRGRVHMPNLGHLDFLQRASTIRSGKAKRLIGYAPRFDLSAGMALTARYLREVYRKGE